MILLILTIIIIMIILMITHRSSDPRDLTIRPASPGNEGRPGPEAWGCRWPAWRRCYSYYYYYYYYYY